MLITGDLDGSREPAEPKESFFSASEHGSSRVRIRLAESVGETSGCSPLWSARF